MTTQRSRARMALLLFLAGSMALSACTKTEAPTAGVRAPVPVRVAKVAPGSISATMSYSGELQPLDQVELLAFANGRLQEIYVEEGAEVSAGAPLAMLETDALLAQVRQAEANVLSAQARLDTVLLGARPEEVASSQAQLEAARLRLASLSGEAGPGAPVLSWAHVTASGATASANLSTAEAAVATARANLATAEVRLQQLLTPTAEDLSGAEAAVAAAVDGVESARSKFLVLKNPTKLDIGAAESALTSAKAALDSADAKLIEVRDSPKAADVAAARETVAKAEASLRKVEADLVDLIEPLNEAKIKRLIEVYRELVLARLNVEELRSRGASQQALAEAEAAVAVALVRLDTAKVDANGYKVGVSVEEIIEAEANARSAQASLASAKAKLEQTLAGATEAERQTARAVADNARANVDSARIRLDKLLQPTAADLAAAEAAVTSAESQMVAAQNKLRTLHNPTRVDLQTSQSAVENARAALQTAEAKFAAEVESARSAQARAVGDVGAQAAAVAQAEQQYALVSTRFTAADITGATAAVAQAEAALELARINFNRATLTAPFDAVVAKKNLSRGATVSAQTSVFSLVSKSAQLVFNVEEGAVGRLRNGQQVSFTLASSSNRPLRGRVASIAPTADAASRTFKVRVTPDPGQEGLRAGMFANLTVAIEALSGVLLVPQEAVVQRGEDSVVYVVRDDVVEQRKVTIGLRNDRSAQVRSGVEEGEEVVIQGNRSLRNEDRVSVVR